MPAIASADRDKPLEIVRKLHSTDQPRAAEGEVMTPRLSHLWLSAAALASLPGAALACPPKNQSQNTGASQADIPSDNVRSNSVATDSVRSDRVAGDHVRSAHSKFRSMVLDQFDANHNGKLDSKERAAANRALSSKGGGPAVEALREQALADFDSNHNGKLEKTEIHKALNTVNPSQTTRVAASGKTPSQSQRTASTQLQQQLLYNGVTSTSSQIQTLESLLANNSGTLTSAEVAAIQTLLTQLLAQSALPNSTTGFVPLTTTTGTTGTGTTTASTTGSGMCSGSGSSSSSGSSGSSGTSTASAARVANAQASNGDFLSAGGGGFGGPGGGGGFRGGRGH